jgi:hypothetical protein
MQRRRVGVARVVDDQHGLAARAADLVVHLEERAPDGVGVLAGEHQQPLGPEAAELAEHVAHLARVVLGVAQGDLAGRALVVADEDREALHLGRGGAREGGERERERDERADHGTFSTSSRSSAQPGGAAGTRPRASSAASASTGGGASQNTPRNSSAPSCASSSVA